MPKRTPWQYRRWWVRRQSKIVAGYLLAATAVLLGLLIWVTWHVLEPACVWAASYDPWPTEG